jgi:N-acetylglucosaminyldiphosphoundecaprenol N-acetyl-beta-D-mannosaminyltransferase
MRFKLGKISINATDLANTIAGIGEAVESGRYGYVCVTNVRTSWLANHDAHYLEIQNSSLMTVPDGMPLVWYAHRRGFASVSRVSGVELMKRILAIPAGQKYSHYFYGSTPETIERMVKVCRSEFPDAEIKKALSPPFRPVEKIDIPQLAAEINRLQPTFFWIGLGAPKQEMLMNSLQPYLEKTVCIGVGLAFEYLAGNVKRAPVWAQRAGLEWLFRIAQQPRNIGRIIKPFSWFAAIYFKSFFIRKRQKSGTRESNSFTGL